MEENRKKTGVEVYPKNYTKLKNRANDEGRKVYELLNEAIVQYLGDGQVPTLAPMEDPAVTSFREYLSLAERVPTERPFADALRKNVAVFLRDLKHRLRKGRETA